MKMIFGTKKLACHTISVSAEENSVSRQTVVTAMFFFIAYSRGISSKKVIIIKYHLSIKKFYWISPFLQIFTHSIIEKA